MRPYALVLVLLSFLLGTATAAPTRYRSFALVVAHNRSLDASLKPLRYADDDGARFYELISAATSHVKLLAVLDDETQKTFPDLAGVSRPPTLEELRLAMSALADEMRAASRLGERTVFYFYFAGHGDVGQDREGFVHLADRTFSRSDLYREVIGRSPADVNHVIIDACNAYFLVNRRGPGQPIDPQQAIRSFLAQESLSRYPNTGVVLSTASMAETHEWSRYQSGIFSHQLLSALWGSGDVDGDGRVDYHELNAYVAAANLRVRDSRARLAIFARPPAAHAQAELFDLTRLARVKPDERRPAGGRVAALVRIPSAMKGHFYLEDDRGVRYLDFNKTEEQPLRLALLDRAYYYLRSESQEAMIRLEQPGDLDAGSLTFSEIPTSSRGSVEQSFRRDLYAVPFGRSFAMGHTAAWVAQLDESRMEAPVLVDAPTAPRPFYARPRTWAWATAGLSVAALAVAIPLQVLADRSYDAHLETGAPNEKAEHYEEYSRRQIGAAATFAIAGTAAVTSTVLFLVDRQGSKPSARASSIVGVGYGPDGATLTLGGRF